MKIGYASDLHLDSRDVSREFFEVECDIMVLAGDIMEGVHILDFQVFWEKVSRAWDNIVYVLGNHEYYRGIIPDTCFDIKNFLGKYSNIHILDDSVVEIGGVKFVGATLWTGVKNGDPVSLMHAKNMSDFTGRIRFQDRKFNAHDSIEIHKKSLDFIKDNVLTDTIVVTHHCPSRFSCHEKRGNHPLNDFFYTELGNFIADTPTIMHWIHGHTHDECEYRIGETFIHCNPRGYPGENVGVYAPKVFGLSSCSAKAQYTSDSQEDTRMYEELSDLELNEIYGEEPLLAWDEKVDLMMEEWNPQ